MNESDLNGTRVSIGLMATNFGARKCLPASPGGCRSVAPSSPPFPAIGNVLQGLTPDKEGGGLDCEHMSTFFAFVEKVASSEQLCGARFIL